MKQGRATTSIAGSTKVEPQSKAVNPEAAAQIGIKQGNHATDCGTVNVKHVPLYEGRGLKAPMVSVTTHKAGSQGKH